MVDARVHRTATPLTLRLQELEFLLDSNVITLAQFNSINHQLPPSAAPRNGTPATQEVVSPPVSQMESLSVMDEKKGGYYADSAGANPPPPAYPSAPAAPAAPVVLTLAVASALYQYNAQDAGDLALMPKDRITVTEYMNAEWWKGHNDRTGHEGIFPRSYVRVIEESAAPVVPVATPAAPAQPQPSNYGNMPLDVASDAGSGAGTPQPGKDGKGSEMGKKFGKKLGNAAVFGAGATIGGKIVSGIF